MAVTINERSAIVFTIPFVDYDDVPFTPTAAAWRLSDSLGNVVNSRSAEMITPSTAATIVLSGDDTAIADSYFGTDRVLTVTGFYDTDTIEGLEWTHEERFKVDDLVNIPGLSDSDGITDGLLTSDGSADSTAAIQAILAALPSGRTWKARVILSGSIVISGTITIPDYTIIDIRGKIRLANNSNVDMFRIGNVTTRGKMIEIRGGEIDGNRANQSAGLCINIRPGEDILIEGCYIHDAKEQNVRAFGDSTRITIRNVRGVDGEAGNIYFLHPTNPVPSQLEITDSTIENCQLYYTVSSTSTTNIEVMNARRILVQGNHLYGTTDFGIHVEENVYGSIFQNNIVHDHNQEGIRVGYSADNEFSNNNIFDNGYSGIYLAQGSDRNTIVNNSAHDNGRSGIAVVDGSYNMIVGNHCLNNNQAAHATYNAGIQILNVNIAVSPVYNTVRDNDCYDTQTPKTQQYGISEGGTNVDFNIFEHNNVRDNALVASGQNIARAIWTQNKSIYRNNIGAYNYCPLPANDATPTVAIDLGLFQTINSNPTTITNFDNGYVGQEITVLIQDANTTIDFTGTALKGNGGVDWTPANGDFMRCSFNGTNWYCSVHDAT